MKVLVVGNGGREHAIVSHLLRQPAEHEVVAAPGNPGIARECATVDIAATDAHGLTRLVADQGFELVIVGPEASLAAGVADEMRAQTSAAVLGTGREGVQLEASKSWAKALMADAGIPTASATRFNEAKQAHDYLSTKTAPIVVKADGLAAGKGAVVCHTLEDAHATVDSMLEDRVFGESGSTVLIEDFLVGEEFSQMIFTDGNSFHAMPISQDHKPIGDGDTGLNTGGMGSYSPVPSLAGVEEVSIDRIFKPLLAELQKRGIDYRGVITGNLIQTAEGPHVIEFNARFGDPEVESTLSLLQTDLAEIAEAVHYRRLDDVEPQWASGYALCVAMTAHGYPGEVRTGDVISGTETVIEATKLFHAGTRIENGQLVTSSGRVLFATGHGDTLERAKNAAYALVEAVSFDGEYHRNDIGYRSLGPS